jgi:hypothetical protein
VFLEKSVISEAGRAMNECIRKVAPKILTWRQYLAAGYDLARRRWLGAPVGPEYVPDFTECVDHFCIHAGAAARAAHAAAHAVAASQRQPGAPAPAPAPPEPDPPRPRKP